MRPVQKGRYRAESAVTAGAMADVLALRTRIFGGAGAGGSDLDALDAACLHVAVREVESGTLVCAYRLLPLPDGAAIGQSYSAQFYDLSRLQDYRQPVTEVGRFCLHPDWHDPDILRVAWGAMAGLVDQTATGLLFGCCSFQGTDPGCYPNALAHLRARYLAPPHIAPRPGAAEVYQLTGTDPGPRAALPEMPTLLRTYLMMGGWVSDHAVIDRQLGTFHLFTGVEVAMIPPARARQLRALAT